MDQLVVPHAIIHTFTKSLLPWQGPYQSQQMLKSLPLLADVLPQRATSPFLLILPIKKMCLGTISYKVCDNQGAHWVARGEA